MVKKQLLSYLFFICLWLQFLHPHSLFCQGDTTFQLVQTIPIQSSYLVADNLQNLYVATEKGQVIKYDKNGKKQFEYNNNRLGKIGKIDVRNPLTILVYYPDLAIIVILDRTLSEIKQLNLFDLDLIEPKAVALANDNNIWIYDEIAAVLKKVSQEGKTIFESRNLNQLVKKKLNPSFLLENNNQLLLSDKENGLFIFDSFGQLKQEITVKGIERFQIIENQVVYWKEGTLFKLFFDSLQKREIAIPNFPNNVSNILINGNLLYVLLEHKIKIYTKKFL